VPYAWLPGARLVRAATDGGHLHGGAPRAVWLTLGTEPHSVSAYSAAQRLIQGGCPCHVVWDPVTGDITQLIPAVRAGLALGAPERLDYIRDREHSRPARANSEGRVCVQIAVLGRPPAAEPFTRGPMNGLAILLDWLDSWSVPRRWPAGRPACGAIAAEQPRSRARWAIGGHFGASQVPGCFNRSPGEIDIDRLTGPHVIPMAPQRLATMSSLEDLVSATS
jgi:hypothetical protein